VRIKDGARRLLQANAVTRGGQAAVRSLAGRANYHVVRGMADAGQRPDVSRFIDAAPWSITTDYVRQATLALLCEEIAERGVEGALGELGVFRGDFAVLMSGYLPDREIHLFDTFEGFAEQDVAVDARAGVVAEFTDFSATDPATVRGRFADPERVHLHQGYFPDSAAGAADDTFALASIDADLYAPVLSGLEWFYPRLAPGGYILVHDFNNAAFGGAKQAVREFQERERLPLTPLPDWGGTAIFSRSG
jgi:O-methyltransferase